MHAGLSAIPWRLLGSIARVSGALAALYAGIENASQATARRRWTAFREGRSAARKTRWHRRPPREIGDLRASLAYRPIDVHLPAASVRAGEIDAVRCGIPIDRPVVVVHVRESTTKRTEDPEDEVRSASIRSYFPALGFLVDRGYAVVRIGDPSMTRIERPGVIDLATHPDRSDMAELWCLDRASFFVACDSGPVRYGWLMSVPTLTLNSTNVVGEYPLHVADRYVPKRVTERATGRPLSASDLVSDWYLRSRKDVVRFDHVENTEAEILSAVTEMEEAVRHPTPPTSSQTAFRTLIEGSLERHPGLHRYLSKGTAPTFTIGAGWIAESFAAGWVTLEGPA